MMSEDEARNSLENLVETCLKSDPEKEEILAIIRNKARPGLPVRGVLESMRKYRNLEYSKEDQDIIEELIYLYG